MKLIIRKTLSFLVIAILGAACSDATTEGNSDAKTAKQVQTAPVNSVNYQEVVFATGRLSLTEEARLSFTTGGIIQKVYVREGQSVRKGQLLAELDLDEIRAKTRQAGLGRDQSEIDIENAKLAVALAERDYRNAQGLYRDSVATLEQLENAEISLENARNQLEAARKGLAYNDQNIEVANFNLKYSRIVAPANGTILKKIASANELVGPGSPVFLFGSRDKAQVIKVNLTDKDIIHIRLDDPAEVTFDAYPGEQFKGAVREIASMADPYTGTYEVEIAVSPGDKQLLSGFIGAVRIFTGDRKALMEIPVDALLSADGYKGDVFVVENNKAVKTPISIFKINQDKLLIEKGLQETDEVIISGVGYLENDDSVMISQK